MPTRRPSSWLYGRVASLYRRRPDRHAAPRSPVWRFDRKSDRVDPDYHVSSRTEALQVEATDTGHLTLIVVPARFTRCAIALLDLHPCPPLTRASTFEASHR